MSHDVFARELLTLMRVCRVELDLTRSYINRDHCKLDGLESFYAQHPLAGVSEVWACLD